MSKVLTPLISAVVGALAGFLLYYCLLTNVDPGSSLIYERNFDHLTTIDLVTSVICDMLIFPPGAICGWIVGVGINQIRLHKKKVSGNNGKGFIILGIMMWLLWYVGLWLFGYLFVGMFDHSPG